MRRQRDVNGQDMDGKRGHNRRVCPRCGSTNVVPIVHGLPTAEADEEAKRGEMVLGGCCFSTKFPNRHCQDCAHEGRQACSNLYFGALRDSCLGGTLDRATAHGPPAPSRIWQDDILGMGSGLSSVLIALAGTARHRGGTRRWQLRLPLSHFVGTPLGAIQFNQIADRAERLRVVFT